MSEFVVPRARGPVRGVFAVPPSKSLSQRALVLAALSEGPTEIVADGEAPDDVVRLAAALSVLSGRRIPPAGVVPGRTGDLAADAGGHGGPFGPSKASLRLDLGMNATGMRFAIALAGLRPAGARTLVTGRPRLRQRPHGPLLRALTRLGARVRRRRSGAVRVLGAPWTRHEVDVPGAASSQYGSALLLAAAGAGGIRVRVEDGAVSRAYLALTTHVLEAFRVPVAREGRWIHVPAAVPAAERFVVEPDASSAAVWWTLAALTGGRARVAGLAARSPQPDVSLLGILARMGARVGEEDGSAVVEGPPADGEGLRGAGDVDLRDAPDLAPLVAVLAARARGTTRVVGARHLRWKESDRIASLAAGLAALGVPVVERDDGFEVRGGGPLRAARVETAGDHRLALAFGALGVAAGGIVLSEGGVVAKSYPGFLAALSRAATTESPTPPSSE